MHKYSINPETLDISPLKIEGLSLNPCYHWANINYPPLCLQYYF